MLYPSKDNQSLTGTISQALTHQNLGITSLTLVNMSESKKGKQISFSLVCKHQ